MDWAAEDVDTEEEQPLTRRPRGSPLPPPSAAPAAGEEGSSSPPLRWVSAGSSRPRGGALGSRSLSPRRGGGEASRPASRSYSPRRSTIVAISVRTTRRAPPRLAVAGDQESGEEDAVEEEEEDLLAYLRDGSARPRLLPPQDGGAGCSASVGGRGAAVNDDGEEARASRGFLFPQLQGPPVFDVEKGVEDGDELLPSFPLPQRQEPRGVDGREEAETKRSGEAAFSFPQRLPQPVVDAADVIDHFATSEDLRRGKAKAELLNAIMGANTGPRAEAIKNELYINQRMLDITRLERWLRRKEAVDELSWFADLCADESKEVPSLDLFESAFRALERASSTELYSGADVRKRWIGSVAVPEFFICPVSRKIMEHPVVIASGKTVDRSALEKWWKNNQHICPVTGNVLAHSVFIPNILMSLCISIWRSENSIYGVAAAADPPDISPQVKALFKELTLMPHSPRCSEQAYNALRRLHKLADKERAIVHLLGQNPGAIAKLASVLPETCLEPNPELDDIILEILEKAASYDPNKAAFGDDRYTIPVLIARAWLGPVPARTKCAKILGLLAADYYNKIKIAELGGFAALIDLLSVEDIDVKKTVARAIASLCDAWENRSRFLKEGVADAAISLLQKDELVLEAQSILVQVDGFDMAIVEILEKLRALSSNKMCNKMGKRLWYNFMAGKTAQRGAEVSSPWVPASAKARHSSSSTSATDVEGPSDCDEQTKEDVKTIVSWLQKRCYYPRTYRYRD